MGTRKPSWDDYFMSLARQARVRSNCMRRQMGAILVRDKSVISSGYNGTPLGVTDCLHGSCPRCASDTPPWEGYESCICVHAETNAILFAARNGISTQGSAIYTGTRPCVGCLKELIQAGVRKIVFEVDHTYDDQLEEAYQRLVNESGLELILVEAASAEQETA